MQPTILSDEDCLEFYLPGYSADEYDVIDEELLAQFKKAETVVRDILRSTQTEFWIKTLPSKPELSSTKIGRTLIEVLRDHCERLEYEFPKHYLNPLVNLLIRHVNQQGLPQLIENYGYGEFHCQSELSLWIKKLNDLVQDIRTESKTKAFIKATRNYFLRGKNNYKSASKLITHLFQKYSRLLVIRIDLKYQDCLKDGDLYKRTDLTFEQARTDRERLFTNMKTNPLFKDNVGWIWKLEYGLRSGFHYHVILFFNGADVRQDITLAQRICEYWDTSITKGQGKAHSCHTKKDKYQFCGIGMVNHFDTKLLDGLDRAIRYLTKSDFYLQLKTSGRNRGFGRKEITQPERIETRGRPRNISLSNNGE